MARGDVPYVYEAGIYENPLRIQVGVNTADEKVIEEFKSSFDPTGQYIVIVRSESAIQE